MRQKSLICCYFFFLCFIASGLIASDLSVDDLSLSSSNWGNQTVSIKLSNTGEDYKFVVLVSEVKFTDSSYESSPLVKVSHLIEPESNNDFTLPVYIPAGYGKVEIDISMYDVVDTLDMLLESQRFFNKIIQVEFEMPEKLKSAAGTQITFPKFVEDNSSLGNKMSLALFTAILEGKTITEIADLFQVDNGFIKSKIDEYQKSGLIISDGSTAIPNFITINKKQADAIKPSIDKAVENLYQVIVKNYSGYDSTLNALVSDGKLTADKNDGLDMGTILYQKYPVTFGLFLWDLLGREFVNDGKPFNIFENSDPCNAIMGDYMYLLVGTDVYAGNSYYYAKEEHGDEVIYCGLGHHNFVCPDNYRELASRRITVRFGFDYKNPDNVYLYKEENVREPLSVLMDGTIEYVDKLKGQLADVFAGTYYDTNNKGTRYWCWDIVVTQLMNKLVENNIIEKDKVQLYRLRTAN